MSQTGIAAVYSESLIIMFVVIEARRLGLKIERTPDGICFKEEKSDVIKDSKK